MIGDNLLRFKIKEGLKFAVIDTETESLSLAFSRPWSIGCVVVENGTITKKLDKFPFIHDLKISKDAAAITKFNYEEYKRKSEPAEKVYKEIAEYLYNPEYLIIGANYLNFDIYQLANLQKYLSIKPDYSYLNRIYDIVCLGRAWKLNVKFPEDLKQYPAWNYRMSNWRQKGLKSSLKQLINDFNLHYDAEKHHGAIWDCEMTNLVFQNLIKIVDIY